MTFIPLAALLLAAPAVAQTSPTPAPAPTQSAPSTTNGIPDTTLSTSPTPSTGPRAQEGNLPTNNAAAASGGGAQPATPVMSEPAAPGTPMTALPSASPDTALPAPAALDHYPICKAGQFDKCMEPGNNGATTRRHRARR